MRCRRQLSPLLLALTLAATHGAEAQRPGLGGSAPDFSLVALDSSTIHLAALRGHPLIIVFWATWCTSCKQEFPALADLFKAHRDDGLLLLAVSSGGERVAKVRRFSEQLALPYPVLLDHKQKTAESYAAFGLPLTVFVDAAGLIRYRVQGPTTSGQLEAGLRAILPKKAESGEQ